jgi:hypothetical protein
MPHTYHTGGIGRDHHLNLYKNRDTPPACYGLEQRDGPGHGPGHRLMGDG